MNHTYFPDKSVLFGQEALLELDMEQWLVLN